MENLNLDALAYAGYIIFIAGAIICAVGLVGMVVINLLK